MTEDGGSDLDGVRVLERMRTSWLQFSGSDIIVAVFVATSVLTFLLVIIDVRQETKRKKPPGPKPWPILGNFFALAGDTPHRTLHGLATHFGGLMYLRLGSVPCIVVSTAAVAKELFKTNDANMLSRPKRLFYRVYNNCQDNNYKNLGAAPYGPFWRQVRKLCATELFSPKRHASYQGIRAEEIEHMMKVLLEDSKKGNAVNLKSWLYGVTANTMTRMLVNKRYFGGGIENQKDQQEFEQMTVQLFSMLGLFVISDYVPYLNFITKLQGVESKFKQMHDSTSKVTEKVFEVEKHRQLAKERANDENYVPDFIDLFLTKPMEDGQFLSNEDIIMVVQDILHGGTETSATTVGWAMAELMLKPGVRKRAQDEFDAVIGTDRLVQESDIINLPYLQAIVKEVFRLHPPAPLSLPRESTTAFEFLGYKFPAHTSIILNLFAIQRDPSIYENPEEFNPDRFMDQHAKVNHLSGHDFYELIPFGAGRRMCPGYTLGNVMVSLILANLLYRFDWCLPEGQSAEAIDMSEAFGMTVSLKNPLCLVPETRF